METIPRQRGIVTGAEINTVGMMSLGDETGVETGVGTGVGIGGIEVGAGIGAGIREITEITEALEKYRGLLEEDTNGRLLHREDDMIGQSHLPGNAGLTILFLHQGSEIVPFLQ